MKTPQRILSLSMLILALTTGCAYRLGSGTRGLPGGYGQISIPMFKNKTQETGVEVSFTNSLIQEFLRSKAGRVVEEPQADVRIEGEISSITYTPESAVASGQIDIAGPGQFLPQGAVLASRYRILVDVNLRLVRRSDREVLWQGSFNGERTYAAPQVHSAGVNSVNPLYNLSARRQNLDVMAIDMMIEAHSRMTENF